MNDGCATMLNPAAIVNREYCIRRGGKWSEVGGWDTQPLEKVAAELHQLKEQIGAICGGDNDSLRKWRLHTQATHPLSVAPKLLREQYNCTGTSQAYCKFLEVLVRYPRILHIPSSSNFLRSFHLCEAPGHFISALDRFLCTFHPKKDWIWEANSLNPHHEGTSACNKLLEDEVILDQPEKWHFGKDNSGDITKWEDDYIATLLHDDSFHLVTADGSLYTQDAPEEQESVTLPIIEAELNIAQQLLGSGGSLIIKIYSMFKQETRRVVGAVISQFDDVYMYKPMSSKGGNNERYLICLGFHIDVKSNNTSDRGNGVLIDCEKYFSALQSSFIRTNLKAYGSITKAEIGMYRNCVLREFRRRILTSYLSNPLRDSHLHLGAVEHPWMDMYGKNYVETLHKISDEPSAVEFLRNFQQTDAMTEHEVIDEVEVEFTEDELLFLNSPVKKLLQEKVVVAAPHIERVMHSMFTHPGLLRSLLIWKPEALVDLFCDWPPKRSDVSRYVKSLDFSGTLTIDASELRTQSDWLCVLIGLLDGIKKEKICQLDLIWSASSTPFVLSRFSASVIAILCVMFFQFRFEGRQHIASFTKPNYKEDIPTGLESYISSVAEMAEASDDNCIHCFVPTSMLAMLHPYLLDLNRRQWHQLLSTEKLLTGTIDNA